MLSVARAEVADVAGKDVAGAAAHEQGPDFAAFRSVALRNARTGEPAELVRADLVAPTADRVAEITRICNEPLVYDVLFRRSLGGLPYPPEKARGFLEWAHRGWREGTHFVFLVRSGRGAVLAALTIKAARLAADEIGYWATAATPGFMTPAVAALCALARAAGYRSLSARTRPDNERSMAVLRRNGFREPEESAGDGPEAIRTFVKVLEPPDAGAGRRI
jgi:RimJ/RimL family protein N-acetyltransferase